MDQAFRNLIRKYALEPSAENAISLANAVLRIHGFYGSNIPDKWHESLTYSGLLTRILQFSEEELAATVTYTSDLDDFAAVTDVVRSQETNVLDKSHPILIMHACIRCGAPVCDKQRLDNWLADPENASARLCDNCIYCAECADPNHDVCSMIPGCPCCDETIQNMH